MNASTVGPREDIRELRRVEMVEDVDGCSRRVLWRARSEGERRDVSIGFDELDDG